MPNDYEAVLSLFPLRTPLPTDGHVLFGPGHWTTARDRTYGQPDATGLRKLRIGKRGRRQFVCECRIRKGTRFYCPGCDKFGLDHLPLDGAIDDQAGAEPADRTDADERTTEAVRLARRKGA